MSTQSQVYAQILSLIDANAWNQLAALCEDYELDVANYKQQLPFYAIQLFTYLIQDNIVAARHLWRRIPSSVKNSHPEIAQVWSVGQQLWIGDKNALFSIIRSEWDETLAPLASKFESEYRKRTLSLLSKSYKNITMASMCANLGLPEDNAIRYCTRAGWVFDKQSSTFEPTAAAQEEARTVGTANLATLASYVVHLEQ